VPTYQYLYQRSDFIPVQIRLMVLRVSRIALKLGLLLLRSLSLLLVYSVYYAILHDIVDRLIMVLI